MSSSSTRTPRPDPRRTATPATGAQALRRLRVDAPDAVVDAILARVGLECDERFVTVPCAAGDLFVAFTRSGFSAVAPSALYGNDPERFALERLHVTGRAPRHVSKPPAGLRAALRSGRAVSLRYDLAGLSPFERAVLAKTLEIPAGEVRPYGWVAREIGRPRAVRAVGSALGRNPVPVLIPCHRVVRSDGHVGNYGLGVPMKRTLLDAEGVDLGWLERLADAGVRFVGSERTAVFCVPSCAHARRIRPGTEARFRSAADALSAGFRACRHCLPISARDAS
jgi:methylated-DNA-[protein]-cysteine S-methyltransferase